MTASAGPALRELHREFGERIAFVTLYVREAHPGERYPQAETLEQKLGHARDYRQRDGLDWPVAVDDPDGTLHQSLDPKPNAAYVVGTDGNVRTLWSNDARALRAGLEAVASGRAPDRAERTTRVVPMMSGAGRQFEILELAGEQAKRDVLRQAPPMYANARLAALFKPLPPLGRGLAAMAVSALAAAAAVAAVRPLLRRATGS